MFNINPESMIDSVIEALEGAGSTVSEEQFFKIAGAINDEMPGVLQVIVQGMAEHWRTEALKAGGWGSKYAPAITYEVEGNKGEIYLDDELLDKGTNKPNIMFAMMMEKGVRSWSIKDALMKSDKVKIGKDGVKYIYIPLPVATPRKKGQGNMQSHFGKREMTDEIYKIVKGGGKIPQGTTLPSGQDVSGLTKYNTRQFHSQYGMFRCVSENSKGWQYPHIPAEPIFPSVLQEVDKTINHVITEFLSAIVKEFSG